MCEQRSMSQELRGMPIQRLGLFCIQSERLCSMFDMRGIAWCVTTAQTGAVGTEQTALSPSQRMGHEPAILVAVCTPMIGCGR